MTRSRTFAASVAVLLSLGLVAAACSSDDDSAATTTASEQTTTAPERSDDRSDEMSDEMADDMGGGMAMPSGPGCAAVPTDGPGSFDGMATDPAATAASNNPLLSTLVSAVGQAGLVDTLNGPGPFTVFAPVDDAFAAVPADQLDAVLSDPELLTEVLTFHVVAGEELSSSELVERGTVTTVQGDDLNVTAEGDTVMVNGSATVICMDVPTANATVHIVDAVLVP